MDDLLKYCIAGVKHPIKITIPGRPTWANVRTNWMIFQDERQAGDQWIAVGLDWCHVEQGSTLMALMDHIEHALAKEIAIAKHVGCEPFGQIPQAKAWIDRWEQECDGDTVLD